MSVGLRQLEAAEELVGPNGENTNLGEEFARTNKRAALGIYLNFEPRYTLVGVVMALNVGWKLNVLTRTVASRSAATQR